MNFIFTPVVSVLSINAENAAADNVVGSGFVVPAADFLDKNQRVLIWENKKLLAPAQS
jgi:hypothetical protein